MLDERTRREGGETRDRNRRSSGVLQFDSGRVLVEEGAVEVGLLGDLSERGALGGRDLTATRARDEVGGPRVAAAAVEPRLDVGGALLAEPVDDLPEALGPDVELGVVTGDAGPAQRGPSVCDDAAVVHRAGCLDPALQRLAHLVLEVRHETAHLSVVVRDAHEHGLAVTVLVVVEAVDGALAEQRAADGQRHRAVTLHACRVVEQLDAFAPAHEEGWFAEHAQTERTPVAGVAPVRLADAALEQVTVREEGGRLIRQLAQRVGDLRRDGAHADPDSLGEQRICPQHRHAARTPAECLMTCESKVSRSAARTVP